MAYSYGDFGKWELDEDEGILACSLFWADENTNLHLAILVLNRAEFLLHVDKDDNDSMELLFPEAKAISYCKMISVVDEKSVLVNFSGHNLVFRKDQYEVVSGVIAAFVTDTCIESNQQINNSDLDKMSGVEFEKLILKLVHRMGFEAETTKASGDGGMDIIAYNSQPFLEGKYIIQCKRWVSSVGEPILRDLYGVVMSERANKGILVTTGNFTSGAIRFSEGKPIELIDKEKINYLLAKYNITSNPGNASRFDLSEWIDASAYENYTILQEELSNDRNNYDARYKAICIIMDRIMNNENFSYKATIEEIDSLIRECRKHLSVIENSQQSNKRTMGLKYVSYFFDAQLYIIQGNFLDSLKCFQRFFDWNYIRATYPLGTIGNGQYVYVKELFAIITNVLYIYSALGLRNKAQSFSIKHDKVFREMSEETIWFCSMNNTDSVTIYDSNNDIDIDRTTANIIDQVKNCTNDFFIFWNYDDYQSDYDMYRAKEDVYLFSFESHYHLAFDNNRMPIGVVGYPQWSDDVIRGMEDAKKRVNLLF